MTQMGTRGMTSTRPISRHGGGMNIYTALAFAAFVALLVAVVFVWFKSVSLFNTQNPFAVLG